MSKVKITEQHVFDAVDKIEREGIKLRASTDYDVIINGKAYPPKEIMRYANLIANGTKDWTERGGNRTNDYLTEFGFEVKQRKLALKEIVFKLRKRFSNVWRCADSGRWNEMKGSGLLTFAWLDNSVNYLDIDFSTIKSGSRAIYPWVNELSVGDLIFVMGKNTFDGICIAETEYDFNGPTLTLSGYGVKPAIRVKYIYKLENPISHNLVTHNNPATFAEIEKYSFGLEKIISFLLSSQPAAIDRLLELLNDIKDCNLMKEEITKLNLNTIIYGPPGTGKTYQLHSYMKRFFIDYNKKATKEEILLKKIKEYSLWEIVAAVLIIKDKFTSVSEICESDLIKLKKDPKKATRSYYLVRNSLMAYSDDDSSDYKRKRKDRFFTKNENAEWSVIDSVKEELKTIIGEDLLNLTKGESIDAAPIQISQFSSRYNFITFHQKYSYEDFIEGIKPLLSSEYAEEQSGELQFELKKGIFYNSCLEALRLVGYDSFEACYQDTAENRIAMFETAKSNPSMQFALFIDEINRANISAVFGELITLLEDDKRIGADNEMWLELPYSNEKFSVPGNLYVIGTMNTADRSIALLDIALRRRFEFKSLYPEYIESEWWASLLEALNQAIYNWKKNPDFFIGHAFFINKPEADRANILNTKIIPLLYEYCQSNAATVKNILSEAGVALKSTGIKENFQIIAE
ncbi:MAG: AAA family ATPase [Bacteroidia bacterium]